ncbi:MAG TPA: aldo/keto reductase, partial [Byssovorax sp.]
MRCRPLGKTGLEVSELALGTWGLSGDAYGPVSEAQAQGVIARALTLGVTTFETADVYGGDGAMEATLAAHLPASAIVVTKIGTDRAASPPRKSLDPTFLRVSFEKCAERLKKKPVDVVLLHNPSMPTLDAGAATAFLRELKKRGLVRAWGVSAGTVAVAREALHQGAEVLELA